VIGRATVEVVKMSLFGSLVTAMVTPFNPDGSVDYRRAEELIDRLIRDGTETVLVAGTTGESPTLTHDEKIELFTLAKSCVGNRAQVIAGTGNYNTAETIEFTKEAEKIGVDGALLVTPYYNKPSQEGLFQHFKIVAESTGLQCLLYNIPGRTSRNIEAKTLCRLSEISNIAGVKESTGDFQQVAAIRAGARDGFLIYSGDDWATLHTLLLGGAGVVSVASHLVGSRIRKMMDLFRSGQNLEALKLHIQLKPLFDVLFLPSAPNPCGVKAALKLAGFDCGGHRLPLVEVTDSERETIRKELARQGLIK
jgi:4-hydroxy-tetrahydrodipicolinate synthase